MLTDPFLSFKDPGRYLQTCVSSDDGSAAVIPTFGTGPATITDTAVDVCNAGDCTKPNPIFVSKASLRYDCSTKTLCILVKTLSPYVLQQNSSNWFKDPPSLKMATMWDGVHVIATQASLQLIAVQVSKCTQIGKRRPKNFAMDLTPR